MLAKQSVPLAIATPSSLILHSYPEGPRKISANTFSDRQS